MTSFHWRSEKSGRFLRFKGPVVAVAPSSGIRSGKGFRRVFRGKVGGCPLPDYGHHLQRYFSKPFFDIHFAVVRNFPT